MRYILCIYLVIHGNFLCKIRWTMRRSWIMTLIARSMGHELCYLGIALWGFFPMYRRTLSLRQLFFFVSKLLYWVCVYIMEDHMTIKNTIFPAFGWISNSHKMIKQLEETYVMDCYSLHSSMTSLWLWLFLILNANKKPNFFFFVNHTLQ